MSAGSPTAAKGPRLRTIALPAEHGSWGLTLEPILAGLLVAASWGGLALGIAALGAFLLRWPLKMYQTGRRKNRPDRARLALRFSILYALIGAVALAAVIPLAGWRPLLPLVMAIPAGILFLVYDAQNKSRNWQAELAGPAAFCSVAAGIALAGGWPWVSAMALWAVLAARSISSILFVRERIRLDRGRPRQTGLALGAHVVAILLAAWLSRTTLIPWTLAAVYVLTFLRAAWGLSPFRPKATLMVIGFTELGWSILTLVALAVGVRL